MLLVLFDTQAPPAAWEEFSGEISDTLLKEVSGEATVGEVSKRSYEHFTKGDD